VSTAAHRAATDWNEILLSDRKVILILPDISAAVWFYIYIFYNKMTNEERREH
jgi:hypothetical protein